MLPEELAKKYGTAEPEAAFRQAVTELRDADGLEDIKALRPHININCRNPKDGNGALHYLINALFSKVLPLEVIAIKLQAIVYLIAEGADLWLANKNGTKPFYLFEKRDTQRRYNTICNTIGNGNAVELVKQLSSQDINFLLSYFAIEVLLVISKQFNVVKEEFAKTIKAGIKTPFLLPIIFHFEFHRDPATRMFFERTLPTLERTGYIEVCAERGFSTTAPNDKALLKKTYSKIHAYVSKEIALLKDAANINLLKKMQLALASKLQSFSIDGYEEQYASDDQSVIIAYHLLESFLNFRQELLLPIRDKFMFYNTVMRAIRHRGRIYVNLGYAHAHPMLTELSALALDIPYIATLPYTTLNPLISIDPMNSYLRARMLAVNMNPDATKEESFNHFLQKLKEHIWQIQNPGAAVVIHDDAVVVEEETPPTSTAGEVAMVEVEGAAPCITATNDVAMAEVEGVLPLRATATADTLMVDTDRKTFPPTAASKEGPLVEDDLKLLPPQQPAVIFSGPRATPAASMANTAATPPPSLEVEGEEPTEKQLGNACFRRFSKCSVL